jgi:TonB family protein
MEGNDKVRFCEQCQLDVYNISAMSSDQAEELLLGKDHAKRLCIRLYRRADGTVLTQDCPIGLRKVQDAWCRNWQRFMAAVVWLLSFSSTVRGEDKVPSPQRPSIKQDVKILVSPIVPNGKSNQPMTGAMTGVVGVDYGPYMADLQRRVYSHWNAPKDLDPLKNTVVSFKVNKDGTVLDLKVKRSSGTKLFDDAALKAVLEAAPFRSLPDPSVGDVDIEFTFNKKDKDKPSNRLREI